MQVEHIFKAYVPVLYIIKKMQTGQTVQAHLSPGFHLNKLYVISTASQEAKLQ